MDISVQVFGTMLLLLCVMALGDEGNTMPPRGLMPICVGVLVVAIGTSFGWYCGYAGNPARNLGPRIFTAFGGWAAKSLR